MTENYVKMFIHGDGFMRVLVVEDEVRLADALVQILAKNKITADTVYDGADGIDNALTGIYDVIVLDIMLPKMPCSIRQTTAI